MDNAKNKLRDYNTHFYFINGWGSDSTVLDCKAYSEQEIHLTNRKI